MTPTITVDIGTTSIKLCLFDAEGGLQAADFVVGFDAFAGRAAAYGVTKQHPT